MVNGIARKIRSVETGGCTREWLPNERWLLSPQPTFYWLDHNHMDLNLNVKKAGKCSVCWILSKKAYRLGVHITQITPLPPNRSSYFYLYLFFFACACLCCVPVCMYTCAWKPKFDVECLLIVCFIYWGSVSHWIPSSNSWIV